MAITSRALAFASRWFDAATVHGVFEPLIADWQREWSDAAPSRRWRVGLRGFTAFFAAVIMSSPKIAATRSPAAVTSRIAVRITRFTAIGTAIMLIPAATQVEPSWARGAMMLFLIPSALVMAFPFAMVGAVDALRRTEPLPPHVERATVGKLGLLATMFMLIVGGWVVPAANHTWRTMMWRAQGQPGPSLAQAPLRGVRELSTYELIAHQSRAVAFEPYTAGADRAVRVRRELSNRIVLAVMPIVLLWLRWHGIEHARGRSASAFPAPLVAVMALAVFGAGSFSGFRRELESGLPRGLGVWLPIAVFSAWVMSRKLRTRLPTLDHLYERARTHWHASRCP
jgi:hypothetical protein